MGGSDLVGFHPNCDTLLLAAERIKQLKIRGQPENEGQSTDITTDLEFSPIADLPTSGGPSTGDQVEEEGQPADSTMTLDYVPVVSDLPQPIPAVLSTPNKPPTCDATCNPGNHTNEDQESTMLSPSQVYQDGNAPQKYVIEKYGDYWYIVKCQEHRLELRTEKPLLGAIKHLRSKVHTQDKEFTSKQMAIAKFGRRVVNCTDKRAEMNNEVAIQNVSYDQVGVLQRRKRTRADVLEDTDDDMLPNTRNNNCTSVSPIKPQPGEVYKIFWGNHGCFYAAVILPRTGSFTQVGFQETTMSIKDTPLVKDPQDIPRCYEYDPASGFLEWAESFGPRGSKASQSKYPAMYLTDPEFEDCEYCWLHVSKLQTYRRNDRNVRFQKSVNNFITDRDQAANGDYIAEPTAVFSGTETTDDRSPISHPSSTAAEQSGISREMVQQSPMEVAGVPLDKSEVQAPEQPAMMDQEELNGQAIDHSPVLEQHDGHMDVDPQVATDSMITLWQQITKKEIQIRNALCLLKHDVQNY
ncbi:hypothetical protein FCULG_00005246 [Fusarium culmorum]|uniref:Uncharacterized protein n=1 Tax=Fusarium culmorum TaxID=5516 RepID=A0A2T4GU21_FUSCU|nr:hypothetical protein FCULG_00005246 [Fusarium culmorum]